MSAQKVVTLGVYLDHFRYIETRIWKSRVQFEEVR